MRDLNSTIANLHEYRMRLEGRRRNLTDFIGADHQLHELYNEIGLLTSRLFQACILLRNLYSYLQKYEAYIRLYEQEALIHALYVVPTYSYLEKIKAIAGRQGAIAHEFPSVAYAQQIDRDIQALSHAIAALPNEAWALRRSAVATAQIVMLQQEKARFSDLEGYKSELTRYQISQSIITKITNAIEATCSALTPATTYQPTPEERQALAAEREAEAKVELARVERDRLDYKKYRNGDSELCILM
jgi:hypothetical protein